MNATTSPVANSTPVLRARDTPGEAIRRRRRCAGSCRARGKVVAMVDPDELPIGDAALLGIDAMHPSYVHVRSCTAHDRPQGWWDSHGVTEACECRRRPRIDRPRRRPVLIHAGCVCTSASLRPPASGSLKIQAGGPLRESTSAVVGGASERRRRQISNFAPVRRRAHASTPAEPRGLRSRRSPSLAQPVSGRCALRGLYQSNSSRGELRRGRDDRPHTG